MKIEGAALRVGDSIGRSVAVVIVVVLAPIWVPILGIAWLEGRWIRWRDGRPPHRVFAWWPVQCDPWPNDGFSGWVWLEMVWRDVNNPGWTRFRREAPEGVAITPESTREVTLGEAKETTEPNTSQHLTDRGRV